MVVPICDNIYTNSCFTEFLVDFRHEHGVRGDFQCLQLKDYLMDVVSLSLKNINLTIHVKTLSIRHLIMHYR